jgi:hypothetical protein
MQLLDNGIAVALERNEVEKRLVFPLWLAWDFDPAQLPVQIQEGVFVENISELLTDASFSQGAIGRLGERDRERLVGHPYGLVAHYRGDSAISGARIDVTTLQNLRELMAYLRLLKPTRQIGAYAQGALRADGSLDVTSFGIDQEQGVDQVDASNRIAISDLETLRTLAPTLSAGMHGDYWKFRMAFEFHEAAYLVAPSHWKAAFASKMSSIEALYTSVKCQGKRVAHTRIEAFLGGDSRIYMGSQGLFAGNPTSAPAITISECLEDLYQLRNCIAHGDRIPAKFFETKVSRGFEMQIRLIDLLNEAATSISGKGILKIAREGLFDHFRDNDAADDYLKTLTNGI